MTHATSWRGSRPAIAAGSSCVEAPAWAALSPISSLWFAILHIDADFFAFCDQDDIWFRDKLTRAIGFLSQIRPETPAVYCGRTEIIDETGNSLGYSPLFALKPSFRNAIIQSIGGGNTMVFNRAARELLQRAPDAVPVSHDWWTYQAVTSVGGVCHYDPVPTLAYRQHNSNTMGANVGWAARLQRARLAVQGRFAEWTHRNLDALKKIEPLMTDESRQTPQARRGHARAVAGFSPVAPVSVGSLSTDHPRQHRTYWSRYLEAALTMS